MTITLNMPAADYHASPAVSNSMLSAMADSPFHCWSKFLDPKRPAFAGTPAMKAGTLLHSLVLEPETMSRYAVRPDDMDPKTKAGKAWKEEQEQAGRLIVSADMIDTAEAQREALMKNAVIAGLLQSPTRVAEASIFWRDKSSGLDCRARPDLMSREGKRVKVLDLKTSSDASPDGFARSVAAFGYHRQRAHYAAGLEAHGLTVEAFIFAAVSSTFPFFSVAYVLDEESEAQGVDEVRELLDLFAQCKASGTWPAYGEGLTLLSLPKWARRSSEVEVSYV